MNKLKMHEFWNRCVEIASLAKWGERGRDDRGYCTVNIESLGTYEQQNKNKICNHSDSKKKDLTMTFRVTWLSFEWRARVSQVNGKKYNCTWHE